MFSEELVVSTVALDGCLNLSSEFTKFPGSGRRRFARRFYEQIQRCCEIRDVREAGSCQSLVWTDVRFAICECPKEDFACAETSKRCITSHHPPRTRRFAHPLSNSLES